MCLMLSFRLGGMGRIMLGIDWRRMMIVLFVLLWVCVGGGMVVVFVG